MFEKNPVENKWVIDIRIVCFLQTKLYRPLSDIENQGEMRRNMICLFCANMWNNVRYKVDNANNVEAVGDK